MPAGRRPLTSASGRRREFIARRIEILIERHGRKVMRLLLEVLDHAQDAEDAWQETWCAIWRARRRLSTGRNAWPFIRTTAVRKALDGRRRKRCLAMPREEPLAREARKDGLPPELRLLPLRERAALVLYFWEGLSVVDIAQTLQVPEGTVKTWMFRGRQRLRRWLTERKEV